MNSNEIIQHNQQQPMYIQPQQVMQPIMDDTSQNGSDNGSGKQAECMKYCGIEKTFGKRLINEKIISILTLFQGADGPTWSSRLKS